MSEGMTRRQLLTAAGAGVAAAAVPVPLFGAAADAMESGFAGGKYVLPPLPYPYEALEPHIDAETMHLHHDAHHKAYVDGANTALDAMAEARRAGKYDTIQALERNLSFNASGHLLHTIFWTNMKRNGGGAPGAMLSAAIERDFGSVQALHDQFSNAARTAEGSGWGLLLYEPVSRRLLVGQAEKHNQQAIQGTVPLLVLDVWEHAYYLKYRNKRPDYIAAWWNVVNWDDVQRRYAMAGGTSL